MIKKQLESSDEFIDHFPQVYKTPKKVNKYLLNKSNHIEEFILNAFKEFGLHKDYAIYANGGFGRQEIYPSSDIDLSIIKKNNKVSNYDNLEKFIATLWDLGYPVGHSVRTLKDIKRISKEDPKEYTSYLTRRALLTDKKLDKDRFRKDLGDLIPAYTEVAKRLGILHEQSNVSAVNVTKLTSIKKKSK